MKLSDFVAEFLVRQGIRHVFLISGGAIVHGVDSVARHPRLQYICTQHEQAAGVAADAYARISGHLGTVMVTSGPGATNLVTSVCNAYFDSIPLMVIAGQVATFRLKESDKLRQKGFQETDVVSLFRSITKYAVQIRRAEDIRYELEKAVHLAQTGRPGPVLIDLPDDVQRVDMDPVMLRSFEPPAPYQAQPFDPEIQPLWDWLLSSERPVLILGAGVRMAQCQREALAFARYWHLPILLTWGAMDLLPYDDVFNAGGLGICGPRGGNFAVQNADLVVAIGTRLSQQITGGRVNLFAPRAKKVMVDIDPEEFHKFSSSSLILDLCLPCDMRDFFAQCRKYYENEFPQDRFLDWRLQIQRWRDGYPIVSRPVNRENKVDVYVFMQALSRSCKEGDIILTDAGGNLSWTMQAFEVKSQQRLLSAWNHSPMGFSLPASIGAALAGQREVICIIGDGGIMMCLEELGTIRRYDLPVKVFIINNHGHGIQKQTLDTWLNSHYVAVDEPTGLYFPDFLKVGEAFQLPVYQIDSEEHLTERLRDILKQPGPALCSVEIPEDQKIVPMLKFGAGLEDLSPPIPREELAEIMAVSLKEAVPRKTGTKY